MRCIGGEKRAAALAYRVTRSTHYFNLGQRVGLDEDWTVIHGSLYIFSVSLWPRLFRTLCDPFFPKVTCAKKGASSGISPCRDLADDTRLFTRHVRHALC